MCLGNGGCSVVNSSSYSEVSGIPVALIGVGGYLAILAVIIYLKTGSKFIKTKWTLIVFGLGIDRVSVHTLPDLRRTCIDPCALSVLRYIANHNDDTLYTFSN